MIESLRFFLSKGLQTAKETNVMREGKIMSDTCPEFVEYMEGLIQENPEPPHNGNEHFQSFLEFSGMNVQKRTFYRWLKKWANFSEMTYQEKPINNRKNKIFWFEKA